MIDARGDWCKVTNAQGDVVIYKITDGQLRVGMSIWTTQTLLLRGHLIERVYVLTQAEHKSVRLLIDVAERYVRGVMEQGVSTEAMEDVVDILNAIQTISALVPLTETETKP